MHARAWQWICFYLVIACAGVAEPMEAITLTQPPTAVLVDSLPPPGTTDTAEFFVGVCLLGRYPMHPEEQRYWLGITAVGTGLIAAGVLTSSSLPYDEAGKIEGFGPRVLGLVAGVGALLGFTIVFWGALNLTRPVPERRRRRAARKQQRSARRMTE